VKAASSPERSAKLVKPTKSAKRTVTCLRSASTRVSERKNTIQHMAAAWWT